MFAPGKPFQPCLMFESKTRSLPSSGASERCFTFISCCLTCKHYTMLERLARGKCSSLLWTLVNNNCKKFYEIDTKKDSQNPMRCIATAIDWARTNIRPIAPPNSGPRNKIKNNILKWFRSITEVRYFKTLSTLIKLFCYLTLSACASPPHYFNQTTRYQHPSLPA